MLAVGLAAWAATCHASFGGPLGPLDPKAAYLVGVIFALPTAGACVLMEAIFPRRRVPLWLTGIATLAALVMFAYVFGFVVGGVTTYSPTGVGERGFLWFFIPPVATLALRGLIPQQWLRLIVGAAISAASVVVGAKIYGRPDSFGILAGGASTCLLFWIGTVLLLRAIRWTPPETTTGALAALAAVRLPGGVSWTDLGPRLSDWFDASLSRRRGVGWWLAIALVLYLGIGGLIEVGGLRDGQFIQHQVWAITDLFGIPMLQHAPTRLWWTFGFPWSLLVAGAAWGIAAAAGAFDPGRLRVLRLPIIVLGGLLLLWTVHIAWQIHTVWSAEEAASGIVR